MCRERFVINKLVLGNRELGWELWDGKAVVEMTTNQIKSSIKSGNSIYGLKISSSGDLVLDREGFFTQNLMVHSHIANYKPMDDASMVNMVLVCTGSHGEKEGQVYHCISNRFEQVSLSEADMKAYLKLGIVSSGARLEGDKIILPSKREDKINEKDPVNQKGKAEVIAAGAGTKEMEQENSDKKTPSVKSKK